MKGCKLWTLTIGLLLASVAFGTAAAEGGGEFEGENTEFGEGEHTEFAEGEDNGVFEEDSEVFDDVMDIDAPNVEPWVAQCTNENGGSISAVADIDARHEVSSSADQEVDVDEDDVLLAIALANNGADDITWEDIRDMTMTETQTVALSQDSDLDREDVFSALALGIEADTGQLGALACAANVDSFVTQTTTKSYEADLEEDTVLLSIALANSLGGDLEFEGIADISTDEFSVLDTSQTVDVDREDTFLALALGAGGEDDNGLQENGEEEGEEEALGDLEQTGVELEEDEGFAEGDES